MSENSTLRPFATWAEVLTHVAGGQPIWYQAPLEYAPVRVQAMPYRRQRGVRLQKPTKVRVYPPSSDCDPFWADAGHLDRFRRLG